MHPGDGRFFDFQTKLRWQDALPHIKILNPKIKFDKFKNSRSCLYLIMKVQDFYN